MNVEVRYNDTKMRMFRICPIGKGLLDVKIGWNMQKPYIPLVRWMSGGAQSSIVLTVVNGERWYHNLTFDQAKLKLAEWRLRCEKQGLNNLFRFNL
jgi:hypothetical protein